VTGCPTEDDDDDGGGGGGAILEEYRGVYVSTDPDYPNVSPVPEWTLVVTINTLEVKKGDDGVVKTIPVIGIRDEPGAYHIRVPNKGGGTGGGGGSTGSLDVEWNEDGSFRCFSTDSHGMLEFYPGNDSGDEIPGSWYPQP
jgi:hypothetical protein